MDRTDLRSLVRSGLGWSASNRFLGQLVSWASTIYVIRLLSPTDYGLLAMAMVFVSFLALMAELGLGPAIVQGSKVDECQLRKIFALVICVNLSFFALLVLAAPMIAAFFNELRLTAIIRTLALQFVLMCFSVIPESLLERSMDFKRRSFLDFSSALVSSATILILALSGFGVWALVCGSMVSAAWKAVGINIVSPFLRRPDFSLVGMRRFVLFGGQVTVTRILWFFYSQADIFVAGKLLGKEMLGFYSVSLHVASLPVQKIAGIINQVAFPAFARIQHDSDKVASHLLKAVRMLSFFAFPVLWGISCVAPELTAVVLGPKWQAAALPMQLLALIMPIRMISGALPSAIQGIGRPDVVVKNSLSASLVMPLAFLIGVHWGPIGLSLSWVIAFPVVFLANLNRSLPTMGLAIPDLLLAMTRPAAASLGMYLSVTSVRMAMPTTMSSVYQLAVLVLAGICSYGILTITLNRSGCREVMDLLNR